MIKTAILNACIISYLNYIKKIALCKMENPASRYLRILALDVNAFHSCQTHVLAEDDIFARQVMAANALKLGVKPSKVSQIFSISSCTVRRVAREVGVSMQKKGRSSFFFYDKNGSDPLRRIQSSAFIHLIDVIKIKSLSDQSFDISKVDCFHVYAVVFEFFRNDFDDFLLDANDCLDLINGYYNDKLFVMKIDNKVNNYYLEATDLFRKKYLVSKWSKNPFNQLKRTRLQYAG